MKKKKKTFLREKYIVIVKEIKTGNGSDMRTIVGYFYVRKLIVGAIRVVTLEIALSKA